ncbi:MAG: family 78 glycoside hydrolase catalytic domain [Candidatus Lokiarchaeota archaeon]|nr:family 78 glycoside hydrolase catalytic domain [Candidatus Lokiarchaeota archaeon]
MATEVRGEGGLRIRSLRCEYLVDPFGIDVARPRLSWVVESGARGARQTAYQIIAASDEDHLVEGSTDLWDSGKVESNQTAHLQYGGAPLASGARCHWKVRAWGDGGRPSPWSTVARWTIGLLEPADWQARWIGSPPRAKRKRKAGLKGEDDPSPLLRASFTIEKKVKRASLHASALGEYEASINGQRVGDRCLAPEYTDYGKRVQYQTYDVTGLLREGENVIGAILADGWYAGNIGFGNIKLFIRSRMYGVDRRFLAQLAVEFTDGSARVISSGPGWRVWEDGPIRRADHYLGEVYDARKERPGWDAPGFDDAGWAPVAVDESVKVNLVAQMNEPIRVVERVEPVSMAEPEPGVFIFDLGQNIAGWCIVRLPASVIEPGATVKVRHGEMLDLDGSLYTGNLSAARAEDVYILAGAVDQELHPRFTYHGFQYVEVTGLKHGAKASPSMVTGCAVASDPPVASAFECSDPSLNRLWRNIYWTLRDNLPSIPTDCPQRSERLGWMGDAQVFSQASMFIMDMAAFYTKWMHDICDAQFDDGRFSNISPNPFMRGGAIVNFRGAPAWADCGVLLPWDAFVNYGDTRCLEEHYSPARRFVDQVHRRNPDLLWRKDRTFPDFGDWLNGDTIRSRDYPKRGGQVPKDVHATIFFARSAELLSKMAGILGKEEDAEKYADLAARIKKSFHDAFVDADGRIKGDTQAGYALALHFDVLPEGARPAAARHLVAALERYDHRLSTGFNSTTRMMLELARWGRADVAYGLLFSKRFPSWYYMIEQGATTMWERWDGFVKGRGFQSKMMNSFCHYSYGSVGEFIVRVILGINPSEQHPGFAEFTIKPVPAKQLSWVKGHVTTIRGTISCEWRLGDSRLDLAVTVPANTAATVHVPASDGESVLEGGNRLEDAEGVEYKGMQEGAAVVRVVSGTFHFASTMP